MRRNKKRKLSGIRQIAAVIGMLCIGSFICAAFFKISGRTQGCAMQNIWRSVQKCEYNECKRICTKSKRNDNAELLSEGKNCMITMEGLSQEDIPTGCESVSTVMALRYAGIEIAPAEFILNYLPVTNFWKMDGELYGADPHEAFVGNPFEKASLGCFSEVIIKSLEKMKQEEYSGMDTIEFKNVSGAEMEELAVSYVLKGIPVIVWVTSAMKPSFLGMRYRFSNGEYYIWRANEHCMVLCGFDSKGYYLMDPQTDGDCVYYEKELVTRRYEEMGREAVVIW